MHGEHLSSIGPLKQAHCVGPLESLDTFQLSLFLFLILELASL